MYQHLDLLLVLLAAGQLALGIDVRILRDLQGPGGKSCV